MEPELTAEGEEDNSVPSFLEDLGGVPRVAFVAGDVGLDPKRVAKGFNLDEAIGVILPRLVLLPDLGLFPAFEDGGGKGRGGNGKEPFVDPVLKEGK
jgi:hypothetical protein